MTYTRLLAAALAIGLSGCAAEGTPGRPKLDPPPAARIGFLVNVANTPVHSHDGILVGSHFEQQYPWHWSLSESLATDVRASLQGRGLVPVDLGQLGFSSERLSGLVKERDGEWVVPAGARATLAELRDRLDLRGVVVVSPLGRHAVAMECAQLTCAKRFAGGMGLYTRSYNGLTRFWAVPGIAVHLYWLSPPADLSAYDPLARYDDISGRRMAVRNIDSRRDLTTFTRSDLKPVRNAILERFREVAADLGSALQSKHFATADSQ